MEAIEKEIGDEISLITSKQGLNDLLHLKIDEYKRLFPNSKSLFKRAAYCNKSNLKRFLRARLQVLSALKDDDNNVATLDFFLIELDRRYKLDSTIDTDVEKMKELYQYCRSM